MTKQCDLEFTSSSFGGGWLQAVTPEGESWAMDYLGEDPYALRAVAGEGWMIEPYAVSDMIESIAASGLSLS